MDGTLMWKSSLCFRSQESDTTSPHKYRTLIYKTAVIWRFQEVPHKVLDFKVLGDHKGKKSYIHKCNKCWSNPECRMSNSSLNCQGLTERKRHQSA